MRHHKEIFSDAHERSRAPVSRAMDEDTRMLKVARTVSGVVGVRVPPITLFSYQWGEVDIGFLAGEQEDHDANAVIYFYPGDQRHAEIAGELAVSFQKHSFEIVGRLQFSLIGVSAQGPNEQVEHLMPKGIEHIVVSDPYLYLALELGLPTYSGSDGIKHYPRLALVVEQGFITRVFRPLRAPEDTAAEIVAWLHRRHNELCVQW